MTTPPEKFEQLRYHSNRADPLSIEMGGLVIKLEDRVF